VLWDNGGGLVIHPDEPAERVLSVIGSVALFAVAEAGASAEAVVGVSGGIAVEHVEEVAFVIEVQ